MFPMSVIAGGAMRKIADEKAKQFELLDVPSTVAELMNAPLDRAARLNRTIYNAARWTAIAKLGR